LPLPVGAWISVWRPAEIAAQPSTWAGVGAANDAPNQSRTADAKASSGSAAVEVGRLDGGADEWATTGARV